MAAARLAGNDTDAAHTTVESLLQETLDLLKVDCPDRTGWDSLTEDGLRRPRVVLSTPSLIHVWDVRFDYNMFCHIYYELYC